MLLSRSILIPLALTIVFGVSSISTVNEKPIELSDQQYKEGIETQEIHKGVDDAEGKDEGDGARKRESITPSLRAKLRKVQALADNLNLPGCMIEKKSPGKYEIKGRITNQCHFGLIWDTYFKSMYEDSNEISKMTRGIVKDPSDFLFDNGAEISISKSHMGLSRMVSQNGHNVLPWLTIKNIKVFAFTIDFAYPKDTDPVDLAFDAMASIPMQSRNYGFVINKPRAKVDQIDSETDVYIQSVSSVENLNAEVFLNFIGREGTSSLYGESANTERFLNVQRMNVRKKGTKSLIKMMLMKEDTWDAYLYGSTSGNNLYDQMDTVVFYCKTTDRSKKENKQMCAMSSIFKNTQLGFLQKRHPFVTDEILDQLQQIPLIKDASVAGLFASKQGLGYPNLKEDLDDFEDLKLVTGNGNKALDIYENLAIPGLCFRFRNEKVSKDVTFDDSYEGALIVHACVDQQGEIEITLPEDWSGNRIHYQGFEKLAFSNAPPPNIGLDDDAIIKMHSISISLNDAGNAETCQGFKPADKIQLVKDATYNDENDKEGFKRLFIRDTEIKQCYLNKNGLQNNGKEWVFKGTGNEIFWQLETSVEILQKTNRIGITTPMNIHSTKELIDRTKANFIADWFKVDFPNMESFPLKDIRLEIFFQKRNTALIKGKTDLPGVENGRIHFLYFNKHDRTELALCINKQGMQLSRILDRMYISGVADRWKFYEEGTIIIRQQRRKNGEPPFDNTGDCRILEEEEEKYRTKDTTKGEEFDGGIMVKAYGINLERCSKPGTEEFNNICFFLWNANAKKPILPGTYYGKVFRSQDFFRLDGDLPDNYQLIIGDFKFHGSVYQKGHGQFPKRIFHSTSTLESGKTKRNVEKMLGLIQVGTANIDAQLSFVGDRVMLGVSQVDTSDFMKRIYNYFPKTRFEKIIKQMEDITNSKVEYLELESHLLVGSKSLHFLSKNSKQYLYPAPNDKRNRYWACTKQVFLKQLFQAFQLDFKHPILSDARLTGCFTFHQMEENWKIESHRIVAEPGFRFYGVVEGYGTIKANILGDLIEMEIVLNPVISKMKFDSTVENKDLLFDNLDDFIDEKSGESAFEFYAEDQDYNTGPTLKVKIGPNIATATLEGYIFMIGYRGKASMDLLPQNKCSGKDCEFTIYHFDNTLNNKPTKIYNEITGDLVLRGKCEDCRSFNEIEFIVDIDLTNGKELQPSPTTMESVSRQLRQHYGMDEVETYISELEDVVQQVNRAHNRNKRNLYVAEKHSHIARLQRARSIQTTRRTCINECPTVKMPGFTTKDCYQTKQGNQAQCLSYMPSLNVANVGCLSKCESEKVMSFIDARKKNHLYKTKLAIVEKDKNILKHSQILKRSASQRAEVPNMALYTSFLNQLSNRRKRAILQITKMVLSSNLKDLESPDCLPFKVSYHINANDDEYSRHKTDENINICFNGDFANDAYKKIVENAYKTELKQLVDYISQVKITVVDKISKLREELEENNDKRDEIRSFPSKMWSIDTISITSLGSSNFHVQDPGTVYAFEEKAPWILLGKNDTFIGMRRANIKSNASFQEPQDTDACGVARANVEKMQGMAKFARKWLNSHEKNKLYLDQVKKYVNAELIQMRQYIGQLKANKTLLEMDEENIKHWSDITEKGMATWIETTTSQMKALETSGPTLIKNEISRAFIGTTSSSLNDYIGQAIKKTLDAYTRMKIPTNVKDEDHLGNVSKNFLKLFKEGTTLTDMALQLTNVENSLQMPDKRTLSCSMKI